MRLSPYDPPGFFTFLAIGLLFVLALVFLPKRVSRGMTAFAITALSILPTLVSFLWVYWMNYSMAVGGYSGPGDPRVIMENILNTSLLGSVMSFLMLVGSGLHTFWLQKRPDPDR
jgi:hypothetical protein